MQVTSAKYDKIFNLCKAQKNRSLVLNVLTRENIEAVQIACKHFIGAKRGKRLANAKSGKTFNLCQARGSSQPAARCKAQEICNRCQS